MHITRKQASRLIDKIREALAKPGLTDRQRLNSIRFELEGNQYQGSRGDLPHIPALAECVGEAHSNPYIDNCGLCRPRWGLVGESVVVR